MDESLMSTLPKNGTPARDNFTAYTLHIYIIVRCSPLGKSLYVYPELVLIEPCGKTVFSLGI